MPAASARVAAGKMLPFRKPDAIADRRVGGPELEDRNPHTVIEADVAV